MQTLTDSTADVIGENGEISLEVLDFDFDDVTDRGGQLHIPKIAMQDNSYELRCILSNMVIMYSRFNNMTENYEYYGYSPFFHRNGGNPDTTYTIWFNRPKDKYFISQQASSTRH